jgi:broad specificity phosphatase PhoE
MKTLLLIRHAHTNMAGRFCGHSDPELSSIGHGQLSEIATQVQRWPLSIVYASDLKRAAQTAQAIASSLDLRVQLRPSLREIYFGDWEGRSWDEIEAADPDFASSWLKAYPHNTPPRGETFHDFEQRVRDELAALAVANGDEVAATVTHAGFIRTALSLISGAPMVSIANIDYASVTELRLVQQKWTFKGQ